MKKRCVYTMMAVLAIAVSAVYARDKTVGLILNEATSYKGYTLFTTPYNFIYLIDNQGMLVNSWQVESNTEHAMLSEDGYLYRGILLNTIHPIFGKPIGGVEKQNWGGTVVWHFIYSGDDYCRHHDLEVLPNGNVLMVAYEVKDSVDCVRAGRDPSSLSLGGSLFADYIVEVEPAGDTGATVVWQWRFWNHIIQDFDPARDNYGVVAAHPELIDFNGGHLVKDWPHLNSVYYNAEFDQIIFNCVHTCEFYVVDRSTTMAEAAGHTGGRYGKGGDLLYRWGNPQIYDQGTADDERLFSNHDAEFVPPGYVSAGHITTMNNGLERGYSSLDEIVPPVDSAGNYHLTGSRYGPDSAIWSWTAPTPADFYFPNGGGAKRLPNGNTLTTNRGEIFQIAPDKKVVWRYINPVNSTGPVHQGDSITLNNVGEARCYPPDFPGFAGRDMKPKGPIEITGVAEPLPAQRVAVKLYPSIANRAVTISYQLGAADHVRIQLYDALGGQVRTLVDETKPAGKYQVRWNGTDNLGHKVNSGVYFCMFQTSMTSLQKKMILMN